MPELLVGCGNHRQKLVASPGKTEWTDLVTLDATSACKPDVLWDLEHLPLPFGTDAFDEVHAYHVLEHTGRQGDYRFFFAQWSEFWRILKPDGLFCGIVPAPGSPWVFGDPGHTRMLPPEVLTFLTQPQYDRQVGITALADYRHVYRADFELMYEEMRQDGGGQFFFVLRAIKPSRISL